MINRTGSNIMSAKEKKAAAKQTFSFHAPLTNERSCEVDSMYCTRKIWRTYE